MSHDGWPGPRRLAVWATVLGVVLVAVAVSPTTGGVAGTGADSSTTEATAATAADPAVRPAALGAERRSSRENRCPRRPGDHRGWLITAIGRHGLAEDIELDRAVYLVSCGYASASERRTVVAVGDTLLAVGYLTGLQERLRERYGAANTTTLRSLLASGRLTVTATQTDVEDADRPPKALAVNESTRIGLSSESRVVLVADTGSLDGTYDENGNGRADDDRTARLRPGESYRLVLSLDGNRTKETVSFVDRTASLDRLHYEPGDDTRVSGSTPLAPETPILVEFRGPETGEVLEATSGQVDSGSFDVPVDLSWGERGRTVALVVREQGGEDPLVRRQVELDRPRANVTVPASLATGGWVLPHDATVSTYVAPPGGAADLTDRGAVRSALAEGWLRGSDTVHLEQDLVVAVSAPGLARRVSGQSGETPTERFRAAVREGSLTLRAKQTEESAEVNPMLQPADLRLLGTNSTRVVDGAADTYYLVVDTSNLTTRHGTREPNAPSDVGDEFEVTFAAGDAENDTTVLFAGPRTTLRVADGGDAAAAGNRTTGGVVATTTRQLPEDERVRMTVRDQFGKTTYATAVATHRQRGRLRYDVDPDVIPWGQPLRASFRAGDSNWTVERYVLRPSPRDGGRSAAPAMTSLVAPAGSSADLERLRGRRALDGVFTASRTVAHGDTLVLVLAADGLDRTLDGAVGDRGLRRLRAAVDDGREGSLTLEAVGETAADTAPKRLDLLDPESTTVVALGNDSYGLVVDTAALDATLDGERVGVDPGEQYAVRFGVDGDRTTRRIAVVPRQVTLLGEGWNGSVLRSPPGTLQVEGRTTLASGSSLTVRVSGDRGIRGVSGRDAVVGPAGAFRVTAHPSDAATTSSVRVTVLDSEVSDDRPLPVTPTLASPRLTDNRSESVTSTTTPTPTGSPTSTVPATRTDDKADAGGENSDGGSLPGFGSLAALLALLVAGLLATRRGR